MKTPAKITALFFVVLFLTACAGNIPDDIRYAPESSPSLTQAKQNIERFTGRGIRWGGMIAGVENLAEQTQIEIVARELDSRGRPLVSDNSPGRFIAILPGFLDPAIYSTKRQITIHGKLKSSKYKQIGDLSYNYPVVEADSHVLWAPRQSNPRHPIYGPYGPFGRYGYYRHFYDPWYYHRPYYRDRPKPDRNNTPIYYE